MLLNLFAIALHVQVASEVDHRVVPGLSAAFMIVLLQKWLQLE